MTDGGKLNKVLSDQLNKLISHLEALPNDVTQVFKRPDALDAADHERSPSRIDRDASKSGSVSPASFNFSAEGRWMRRHDAATTAAAASFDAAASYSKLSPALRSPRANSVPGVVRSILAENIDLAMSVQKATEQSKEIAKALEAERLNVSESLREVDNLKRLLEISRESEKFAFEDVRICETKCSALIQSIKDQVSEAWTVEEQTRAQMSAEIDRLKREVQEFEAAKQVIAGLENSVAERDEQLVRLQSRNELEKEHLGLLHEEECVALKQQHELYQTQTAAKFEEVERYLQSFESAVAARVQDELSVHHARSQEDAQRYSEQIDGTLGLLEQAREQRAQLAERIDAKSEEANELSQRIVHLKAELQKKDEELAHIHREKASVISQQSEMMEYVRQHAEEETAAVRQLLAQKQAELDARWAALKSMKTEIEESALVDSQMKLEAAVSNIRQRFLWNSTNANLKRKS